MKSVFPIVKYLQESDVSNVHTELRIFANKSELQTLASRLPYLWLLAQGMVPPAVFLVRQETGGPLVAAHLHQRGLPSHSQRRVYPCRSTWYRHVVDGLLWAGGWVSNPPLPAEAFARRWASQEGQRRLLARAIGFAGPPAAPVSRPAWQLGHLADAWLDGGRLARPVSRPIWNARRPALAESDGS